MYYTHKFMQKYFDEDYEYPLNRIIENPLPPNTMYSYISSTYLNGFINYVKIEKAFVISRYNTWFEESNDSEFIVNGIDYKTKDNLFNHLINSSPFHSGLDSAFRDDVLIIGCAEDNPLIKVFFWYDRDCSDCSIGKIVLESTDDISEMFTLFTEYVFERSIHLGNEEPREIPLTYFKGWISG